MTTTEIHSDTTVDTTTAHVATTTITTTTTTTTTQLTSTSYITTAVSWITSSNGSLENSTSSEPGLNPNRGSQGESQEHVAIICGVVFGVLGLAVAVVALYIFTRKMKEKRTANRHAALKMKESGSKPYESVVEKDFDSVHDYREMEQPIRWPDGDPSVTSAAEKHAREADAHSSKEYENLQVTSKPSDNRKVSSEPNEEYESMEMHGNHPRSNQNSTVVNKQNESSLDSNPPKHNRLISESSYVNMNETVMKGYKPHNRRKEEDEGTYANAPPSVTNGPNGHSEAVQLKLPKIDKKKDKYNVGEENSADQSDITAHSYTPFATPSDITSQYFGVTISTCWRLSFYNKHF
ncbi:hypothetical protein Btru_051188 [Bulinus truncatus]|nr:hypothetical protein Btru_051188 [Bulinus truncatus]